MEGCDEGRWTDEWKKEWKEEERVTSFSTLIDALRGKISGR